MFGYTYHGYHHDDVVHRQKFAMGTKESLMASLYVIRGRDVGKHFSLQKNRTRIGRDADNEFQLHDTEVSRHHALIERVDEHYEIRDLESSNGTFINSSRTQSRTLNNGDRLQVGRTLMIFTDSGDPVANSTQQYAVDVVTANSNPDISRIRRSLSSPDLSQSVRQQAIVASNSNVTDETPSEFNTRNHWEIIYRTALAVSRTLDIDQLLAQILDLVFQWIDCDRGCILLMDDESRALRPACRKNRKTLPSGDRMELSKTILDYVIENSEGVWTTNAKDDERWQAGASIVNIGIQEAICVPMQGRYGTVGVIHIDTSMSPGQFLERDQKSRFNEDHLKLMVAIGHQAALAIEDTTYYRGMVQAERLAVMGQTIATLSHHIKNILQGIQGGSFLVDDAIKKQDWQVLERGWKVIEKNQDRISALVMDMLTFSKDRVPELKPTDPRLTVDDVLEILSLRAKQSEVNLVWKRPDDFPLVDMDSEAMHRAILNVVSNAMDAVDGSGSPTVTIAMRILVDSGRVSIDITDNGPGISEEMQSKIFSAFESTKGSHGTGLGLPVSQKILQEHSGEITVRSQLGQGTTFSLTWPIHGNAEYPPNPENMNRPTVY